MYKVQSKTQDYEQEAKADIIIVSRIRRNVKSIGLEKYNSYSFKDRSD